MALFTNKTDADLPLVTHALQLDFPEGWETDFSRLIGSEIDVFTQMLQDRADLRLRGGAGAPRPFTQVRRGNFDGPQQEDPEDEPPPRDVISVAKDADGKIYANQRNDESVLGAVALVVFMIQGLTRVYLDDPPLDDPVFQPVRVANWRTWYLRWIPESKEAENERAEPDELEIHLKLFGVILFEIRNAHVPPRAEIGFSRHSMPPVVLFSFEGKRPLYRVAFGLGDLIDEFTTAVGRQTLARCNECKNGFVARRKGQYHCSHRCSHRVSERARYKRMFN